MYIQDNREWLMPYRNDLGKGHNYHTKYAMGNTEARRWILREYIPLIGTAGVGVLSPGKGKGSNMNCPSRVYSPETPGSTWWSESTVYEYIIGINYNIGGTNYAKKHSSFKRPSETFLFAEIKGNYIAQAGVSRRMFYFPHSQHGNFTFVDGHAAMLHRQFASVKRGTFPFAVPEE